MRHTLTYRPLLVKCSCGWRYERPVLFGHQVMTNRAVRKHFESVEGGSR